MRIFPIIAAVFVALIVYLAVLDRDRVTAWISPEDASPDTTVLTTQSEVTPTEPATDAVGVVAIRSVAQQVGQAVVLRGQTEAFRQVELRAETSGQVISTPLRSGAFVEQDQILCELDPATRSATLAEASARLAEALSRVPEAQAQVPEAQTRVAEAQARVTEANARLEEAKINYTAALELNKEGFATDTRVATTLAAVRGAEAAIVSAEAMLNAARSGLETAAAGIEAAKAGIKGADAAVAAAQEEINRLALKAPFAGLLESDTAELGSLLQAGSLCATVIQLDPIKLVGFVPEIEVDNVKMGALAKARLASGAEVAGKVTFVSRSADETTRTFRVVMEVPNPQLTVRDGQTAEILIAAEGTAAHLLPQSALTLDDSGTLGVRIVTSDDMAEFRAISLLRDTAEGIWVAGLPDQADIIVIGQEYVTDGVRVAATFQEITQ